MTTDPIPLQERIAYAVHDMRALDKHPVNDDHPFNIAAAVLPILRAAQADAWDEGSGRRDDLRPNPYREQED